MKRIISGVIIAFVMTTMVGCSFNSKKDDSVSEENGSLVETSVNNLSDKDKYYSNLFGQGDITDIYVDISEEDWQSILDNPTAEEYHSADITVNGTKVTNVGFRTKGFSSLTSVANSDSDRYGFRVKADKYVKDQTIDGLDDFVLNGSFSDPSYMREYLTYAAMAELGGITPFVSYTNLYVNGELYGFYLCIEAYDDSFVERNTSTGKTALYKADSENCTLTESDDASGFDQKVGEKDNNERIKNLISVLNSTNADNKEELEKIFDVSSALKAFAVNTVLGNYDSYSGSKAHNYYLLSDGGKLSYVGWDYNMSMGGFSEDNGASVSVDITSPIYGVNIEDRPLISKLLDIDEYYQEYIGYVNNLCDWFSNIDTDITELADKIRSNVENDPSAFYTVDKFEENIAASDTDLSQVQGNMAGGKGQRPEGMQQPQDGTAPQMPEGMQQPQDGTAPQLPEGMQQPQDGTAPQMPDGMQKPQDGEVPQMPDGMKNAMGGMINNNTVSIVDYIMQRIANIKTQL